MLPFFFPLFPLLLLSLGNLLHAQTGPFQINTQDYWERTATNGARTLPGRPVTLTWSIAPDGTSIPAQRNIPGGASRLREWLASLYGEKPGSLQDQPWFPKLEAAFQAMAAPCGVTLIYESQDDGAPFSPNNSGLLGTRGDLRLAALDLDGPGGTHAYAEGPGKGEIVLDSSDPLFSDLSRHSLNLHNVLAHEVGHTLGLLHVCPPDGTKLMESAPSRLFRGPQSHDIASLHRLFGDRFERPFSFDGNTDQLLLAPSLELPPHEPLHLPQLSLSDGDDRDLFLLDFSEAETLTVFATPAGPSPYPVASVFLGVCQTPELFTPRTQFPLQLRLLDSLGRPVSTASQATPGERTSLTVTIPSSDRYYLEVSSPPALQQETTQQYLLTLSKNDPSFSPSPRLQASSPIYSMESLQPADQVLTENEIVLVSTTITNIGAASSLPQTLSASSPDSLFPLSRPSPLPLLLPGTSAEVQLYLTLHNSPAENPTLQLASNRKSSSATLTLSLPSSKISVAPTSLRNWAERENLTDGAADSDSDGLPNFLEFLLDLPPRTSSPLRLNPSRSTLLLPGFRNYPPFEVYLERSTDAENWDRAPWDRSATGLLLDNFAPEAYFRLGYEATAP